MYMYDIDAVMTSETMAAHTAGEITSSVLGGIKRFECQVIGLPRPSVRWYKDDVNITTRDRYKFDYTADGCVVLTLENVTLDDQGIYRCSAQNSEGSADTEARLYVKGVQSDVNEDLETVHTMPLPQRRQKLPRDADDDSVLTDTSFESTSVTSAVTSSGEADLDELANEFEQIAAMFKSDESRRMRFATVTDSGITSRGSSFSSEADTGIASEIMQEMREYLHGKGDSLFESFESVKVRSSDSPDADAVAIQKEKYDALSQSIKSLKRIATESRTSEGVADIDMDKLNDLEARVQAGKILIEQTRHKVERHAPSELETISKTERYESFSSETTSYGSTRKETSSKTEYSSTDGVFQTTEVETLDFMNGNDMLEEIKPITIKGNKSDDLTSKMMEEMKQKKFGFDKFEKFNSDFDEEFTSKRKGKLQRKEEHPGLLDHKAVKDTDNSILAGKYLFFNADEVETEKHSYAHELHYMYKAENVDESTEGRMPLNTVLKEAIGLDENIELQTASQYEKLSSSKSKRERQEADISKRPEAHVTETTEDIPDGEIRSVDGALMEAPKVIDTASELEETKKTDAARQLAGLKYSIKADDTTVWAEEGTEVEMKWKVIGISTSKISIYKNGTKVVEKGSRCETIRKEESCSLRINSAAVDDTATYSVRVDNSDKDEGKTRVKVEKKTTKGGDNVKIAVEDSEVIVKEKKTLRIRWRVIGIKHSKLVIYKNGKKVIPDGDRVKTESDGDDFILTITDATLEDGGTYTLGVDAKSEGVAPVVAKVVPEGTILPEEMLEVVSEKTEIITQAKQPIRLRWRIKGLRHSKVVVYKNGKVVEPDDHLKLKFNDDELLLTVDSSTVDDSATYAVKVEDAAEEVAPVEVKVIEEGKVKVKVVGAQEEVTAEEGKVFELKWKITGVSLTAIGIYRNGKKITEDDRCKLSLDGDVCILKVSNAIADDAASYTVRVGESSIDEGRVKVTVVSKTEVEVITDKTEVVTKEGKQLKISWTITGISSDEVQICKDGSPIVKDDRTNISFDGDLCTLIFDSSVSSDAATYGIKVDNSIICEVKAKVEKAGPQVEVFAEGSEVKAKEGEKVKLSWKISGVKPSDIKVFRDGTKVKSNGQYKLKKDGDIYTLIITSASTEDNANFTVRIGKTDETDYGKIAVKVESLEAIEETFDKVEKDTTEKIPDLSKLPEPKIEVLTETTEAVKKEGEAVQIKWKIEGIESDKVQICKEGSPVAKDDHTCISFDGDICTLTLEPTVVADTATYGVKIDNSVLGEVKATVEKAGPQVEVLTEGSEVKAKEAEKVKLSWKISGIESDKVQICKDGSPIAKDDHTCINFDGDVCTLTLEPTVVADTATYGVKIDNSVLGEVKATVEKAGPQVEVVTEGSEVKAKEAEKVKLSWKISGVKPSDIKVFRDGTKVKSNGQYKLKKDGDVYTLIITSASAEDNANFTVRIGKTDETDYAKIAVKVETLEAVEESFEKVEKNTTEKIPDLSKLPEPKIEVLTETTEVVKKEGDAIELKWNVTGVASSEVSVCKSGKNIQAQDDHTKISFDGDVCTLTIQSATADDTSDFSVRLNNSETDHGKISVNVAVEEKMEKKRKSPPETLKKPKKEKIDVLVGGSDLTTSEGKVVELEWKIEGANEEMVQVLKDKEKLSEDERCKVSFTDDICILTIHPATVEDSAIYSVVVDNADSDEGRIKVKVEKMAPKEAEIAEVKAEKVGSSEQEAELKAEKVEPKVELLMKKTKVTKLEGERLEVKWKITDATEPDIKVCKDGVEVVPDDRIVLSFLGDVETMTIKPTKKDDSATYSVRVSGSDKDLGTVEIKIAPEVKAKKPKKPEVTVETMDGSEVTFIEGDDLTMSWKVTGATLDDINIFKDGEKLSKGLKYKISFDGEQCTLTVRKATSNDAADYSIRIDSDFDQGLITAKIEVEEDAKSDDVDQAAKSEKSPKVVEEAVQQEKVEEVSEIPETSEAVKAVEEVATEPKTTEEIVKKTEEQQETVEEDSVAPEKVDKVSKIPEVVDESKKEPKQADKAKEESPKVDEIKEEPVKVEKTKDETKKDDQTEEPKKTDKPKEESKKSDEQKEEPKKSDESKVEPSKVEEAKEAAPKVEEAKEEPKTSKKLTEEEKQQAKPVEEELVAAEKVEKKETALCIESLLESSTIQSTEGDDVNMQWKITGLSDAEVSVYKDGEKVTSDDHTIIKVDSDICSVSIQSASVEDSATYSVGTETAALVETQVAVSVVPKSTVEATSKGPEKVVEVIAEARVIATEKDTNQNQPEFRVLTDGAKVETLEGKDVELKWQLAGVKEADISLIKNGEVLTSSDHVDVVVNDDHCSVTLHSTTVQDSATFSVKVDNSELTAAKVAVEVISPEETKDGTKPDTDTAEETVVEIDKPTKKAKAKTVESKVDVESTETSEDALEITADISVETAAEKDTPTEKAKARTETVESKVSVESAETPEDALEIVSDSAVDTAAQKDIPADMAKVKAQTLETKVNVESTEPLKDALEITTDTSLEKAAKKDIPADKAKAKTQTVESEVSIESTDVTEGALENITDIEIDTAKKSKAVELQEGVFVDTRESNVTTEVSTEVEGDMIKETIETFQETILEGELSNEMTQEDIFNLQHKESRKELMVTEDGNKLEVTEDFHIVAEVQEVIGEEVDELKTVTTTTSESTKTVGEDTKIKMIEEEKLSKAPDDRQDKQEQEQQITGKDNQDIEVTTSVDSSDKSKTDDVDAAVVIDTSNKHEESAVVEETVEAAKKPKEDKAKKAKVDPKKSEQEKTSKPTEAEVSEEKLEPTKKQKPKVPEKTYKKAKAKVQEEQAVSADVTVGQPNDVKADITVEPDVTAKATPQDQATDVMLGKADESDIASEKTESAEALAEKSKPEQAKEEVVDKPSTKATKEPVASKAEEVVEQLLDEQLEPKPVEAGHEVEKANEIVDAIDAKVTEMLEAKNEAKDEEKQIPVEEKMEKQVKQPAQQIPEIKDETKSVKISEEKPSNVETEVGLSVKTKLSDVDAEADLSAKTKPSDVDMEAGLGIDVAAKSETEQDATLKSQKPGTEPRDVEESIIIKTQHPEESSQLAVFAAEPESAQDDFGLSLGKASEKWEPRPLPEPRQMALMPKEELKVRAFVEGPEIFRLEGEDVRLKWTFEGKDDNELITICKDGLKISPDFRVNYIIEDNYCVLKIHKACMDDDATYCLKLEDKVLDQGQVVLHIEPPDRKRDKPSFTREPSVDVVDGSKLSLKCAVDGYPKPEVKWYLHGEELGQDALFNSYTKDGYHHLGVADPSMILDKPVICKVENKAGSAQSVVMFKRDGHMVYCEPVFAPESDEAEEIARAPTMEVEISETNCTNLHKIAVQEAYTDNLNHVSLSVGDQVEVLAKNVPGAILARKADDHNKVCYVANQAIIPKTAASDVSTQESAENAADASRVNKTTTQPETEELLEKEEATDDATMPERRKLKSPSPQMTSTPKLRRRELGRESPEDLHQRLGFTRDSPSPKKELSYDHLDIPDYDDGTTRPSFTLRLRNTTAKPGERAQLECKVSGTPAPKVLWLKNNRPLKETDNCEVIIKEDGTNVLVFPEVTDDDVGVYTARAMNVNGSAMCTAELTQTSGRGLPAQPVPGDTPLDMDFTTPTYFFQMSSCEVSEGRMARFDCRVVAYPRPEIVWMRDGKVIDPKDRFKLLNFNNEIYSLLLQDVKLDDSGRYTCWARNKFGEAMTEAYLNVIAMQDQDPDGDIAPQFLTKFYDQQTTEGLATEFKSFIAGRPEPEATWFLNDIELRDQPGQRIRKKDGMVLLEMKQPKLTQAGEYTCVLKNRVGEATCSARLTVIEDKLQGRMLPKFFKKFDHTKAREGEEVKFTVVCVGEPKPTVTWMFDHKTIDVSNRRFTQKQDGDVYTLTIKLARFEDAGTITCKASNSEGEVYCSANLHIRESKFLAEQDEQTGVQGVDDTDSKFGYVPTFTKRLQDCKVSEGNRAKFDCKVMGIPEPEISWMKDGRVIAPGGRFHMHRDGNNCELTIDNVSESDTGVYTCIISNSQGKSSSTAELKLDTPKKDRYSPEKTLEDKPSKRERERYSPEPYVKKEPYVKPEPYTPAVRPKTTKQPFSDRLAAEKFDDIPRKSYESPLLASKYDDFSSKPSKYDDFSKPSKFDDFSKPSKYDDFSKPSKYDDFAKVTPKYEDFTMAAPRRSYESPVRRTFDSPTRTYPKDDYKRRSYESPARSYSFDEPMMTYVSPIKSYGLEDSRKPYVSPVRRAVEEPIKPYVSPYAREEPRMASLPPLPRRKYSLPTNLYTPVELAPEKDRIPVKPRMPFDRPTILNKRDDSVRLSWMPVPTQDLPLEAQRISYIVEQRETPRSDWSRVASDVPGTSYMIKHLRPDKEYEFRVRAQNPYGTSEPTIAVPLEKRADDTKKYPDVPEMRAPPTLPSYKPIITDLGEETLRLAWRPAETYEAKRTPPVSYRLEAKELPGRDWMPLSTKLRDTTHYLSELPQDRDFMIRVRAENDFGISEPTESLWLPRARTFPGVPVGRPEIIDFEATRAKLSWARVDIPSYGPDDEPLLYMLEAQEPHRDWRTIARDLDDTEYTIDGLKPGSDYKFRVRAKLPTGAISEPSPATSMYTALARSRAPVDRLEVVEYEPDNRSVSLSWQRVEIPPYSYDDQPLMYMIEYQEPPMPDWHPLVSGIPTTRYRVMHLDPQRDYNFRVRALTPYGISPPSTALPVSLKQATVGRPVPEAVTMSELEPTSVRLTWRRPMYDLSRPVSYDVEMLEPPFSSWRPLATGIPDTTYRVTGLKPTKDYQFRVTPRVDTQYLTPLPTASLTSQPVKPRLPSYEPKLSVTSPESARLSWQPAEMPVYHRTKIPIYYRIEMQELPSSNWVPVARRVPDTSYNVTGLRPNIDYKFRVFAETEYGTSEPSLPASLYRKPAPKFALKEPSIGDMSQNIVQLTWEPATTHMPAGVVSYVVEVQSPPGIGAWTTLYASHPTPSVRLADLRPDLDYLVRVRAKCGDYTSEPTMPVYIPRRAAPPRMSTEEPYAVEINADSVKLHWRSAHLPSHIMDYAPISYRLEAQELPGGDWITVARGIPHTDFKVTGLNPSKDYNFRIRAENDYGVSDATHPVKIQRRSVAPNMPQEEPMMYDISPASIRLSWRPATLPSHLPASSSITYTIYVQEPPSQTWRPLVRRIPATQYFVSGLNPDRDYYFRVQAENEHGQSRPSSAVYLPRYSDIKRPISIPEIAEFDDDLTMVKLQWKPRAGSPFDSSTHKYQIESWEPVQRQWCPVARGIRDTSYQLKNLPRTPDHLFRVRMESDKPTLAEPSMPISVSKFYSMPKMPVHRPQLAEMDTDAVRLSWQTSFIPEAAKRKIRYSIEQREVPDGRWHSIASDIMDENYRVRGLNPRFDYEFRVRVFIDGVGSEPSYPVSLYRRAVVPKVKLETPQVIEVDEETIGLRWNRVDVPAFEYSEEPLSFMIERQSLPNYEWTPVATNITSTSYQVKDLKPYQDYKFRIRGVYASGYTEPSPAVPVYRRPSESKLGVYDVESSSQKYKAPRDYSPLPTESLHSTPIVDTSRPKKRYTRKAYYDIYDSRESSYTEAPFQPVRNEPTPPPPPKFRRENAYVYKKRTESPMKEQEIPKFTSYQRAETPRKIDDDKDLYHWYMVHRRASDAGLEDSRRRRREAEEEFRLSERRDWLMIGAENRRRRLSLTPTPRPRPIPTPARTSEVTESYASVADRYEDIKCPHIMRPGHWKFSRRRASISVDHQDMQRFRQASAPPSYRKPREHYRDDDTAKLYIKPLSRVSRFDTGDAYGRSMSLSNDHDQGFFRITKFCLSISGDRRRSHSPPATTTYRRPASLEPTYTPRARSLTPDLKKLQMRSSYTKSSYSSTTNRDYTRPRSYSISVPAYEAKPMRDIPRRPSVSTERPKFNRLVENSKSLVNTYDRLDRKCEERLEESHSRYVSRRESVSRSRAGSVANIRSDPRFTTTPRNSLSSNSPSRFSKSPSRFSEVKSDLRFSSDRRASVAAVPSRRATSLAPTKMDPSVSAPYRRATISTDNDDLKSKLDQLNNRLELQKPKKKKRVMKVKSSRGEGYVMDDGSFQPK